VSGTLLFVQRAIACLVRPYARRGDGLASLVARTAPAIAADLNNYRVAPGSRQYTRRCHADHPSRNGAVVRRAFPLLNASGQPGRRVVWPQWALSVVLSQPGLRRHDRLADDVALRLGL